MPLTCILPSHVLREIARNGTPAQRDAALRTLAVDDTHRARRTYANEFLSRRRRPPSGSAVVHRTIYSAKNRMVEPGVLVRAEAAAPSTDGTVNEAYDGLGHVFDFYLAAYKRNSIDDHGLPLIGTVHYGNHYDNAFWDGHEMIFGDGDGVVFNRFTIALDVIGHELTHGVTASEVNLAYLNESGALNESVSDVFGSLVKQYVLDQTADTADWLVGSGLIAVPYSDQALRSMRAPGSAYDNPLLGKDPQPADYAHYVETAEDNGGVHLNSGIPNHAFYLTAKAIGGNSWVKAGQIWYDTIRDPQLRSTASFAAFAGRTLANAAARYGTASPEHTAVDTAWAMVDVKPA